MSNRAKTPKNLQNMKNRIFAAVAMLMATTTFAANDNYNLRVANRPTEISVGAGYTQMNDQFGNNTNAYGISVEAKRLFPFGNRFNLIVGGEVGVNIPQNSKWGLLTNVDVLAGVRLGNKFYVEADAKVGLNERPYFATATAEDGSCEVNHYRANWKPAFGPKVTIGYQGKKVGFALFAEYMLSAKGGNLQLEEHEGFVASPIQFYNTSWTAGAKLTFFVNKEQQYGGDAAWGAYVGGGYSFLSNKGPVAMVGLNKFKRTGAKTGLFYGAEVRSTQTDNIGSAEAVMGTFSFSWLPMGSANGIFADFGVKAGFGEYLKQISAESANGYTMSSKIKEVCPVGMAALKIGVNLGRVSVWVGGDFGGHIPGKSGFVNLDGSSTKTKTVDGSVTAGVRFNF